MYRILLVEDDKKIQALIVNYFRSMLHQTGKRALKRHMRIITIVYCLM